MITITLQDHGDALARGCVYVVGWPGAAGRGVRALGRAYSSAVEHRIADPAVAGSIPAAPLTWNFFSFASFSVNRGS